VHELWSGGGASPNAGHFGRLALGLQPGALAELSPAEPLEEVDLALVELADEEVQLPVAVHVRQARTGVTGGLDANRDAAGLHTNGRREIRSPGQGRAAEDPQ